MTAICLRASSETPTLYFYGELADADRASFEQHLAACPACALVLDDLAQVRAALAGRADAARDRREWDSFMQRLERAVDGRLKAQGSSHEAVSSDELRGTELSASHSLPPRPRASSPEPRAYVWLAVAAALIAGIALGLFWIERAPVSRGTETASADSAAPALDAAAARHFERAKLVLLGLALKDPSSARADDWQYERGLAASLLPETRLFRLSAADSGNARLAGLLEDLEAVLLQAAMSSDADPPELQRLQRIIRGRDLLVRMDVTTQGI
jgi:hypothetical protein